jgi:hypothetical protein
MGSHILSCSLLCLEITCRFCYDSSLEEGRPLHRIVQGIVHNFIYSVFLASWCLLSACLSIVTLHVQSAPDKLIPFCMQIELDHPGSHLLST